MRQETDFKEISQTTKAFVAHTWHSHSVILSLLSGITFGLLIINSTVYPQILESKLLLKGYGIIAGLMTAYILINTLLSLLRTFPTLHPPVLTILGLQIVVYVGLICFAIPYILWDTTALIVVSSFGATILGYTTVAPIIGAVLAQIGGFMLGAGLRAYSSIHTTTDDLLYIKALRAIQDVPIEPTNKTEMVNLLVNRKKVSCYNHTVEEWADIDRTDDEWEWDIRPADIRTRVAKVGYSEPPFLPITKKSHYRWRVGGLVMILLGAAIPAIISSSEHISYLSIGSGLLLGYISTSLVLK